MIEDWSSSLYELDFDMHERVLVRGIHVIFNMTSFYIEYQVDLRPMKVLFNSSNKDGNAIMRLLRFDQIYFNDWSIIQRPQINRHKLISFDASFCKRGDEKHIKG